MTKKPKVSIVKAKAEQKKSTEKSVLTNEIDDLFSVFVGTKNRENNLSEKKDATLLENTEVSQVDLEGLEEEECEEECNEEFNEDTIVKGTAYDPKKDDFSTSSALPSLSSSSPADLDFFDSRGLKRKTRALTEDGLPIFTPKELKIGFGGGTDLCPFECNCCF